MLKSIGIPLSFLILATLILWFLIGAKGHWLVKVIVTSLSLAFCILLWNSVEQALGFPTTDDFPKKFEIYSVTVREPYKDKAGAIFFWIKNLNDVDGEISLIDIPLDEPRSYRIEYSRELHKQTEEILKMLQQGKRVVGNGDMINKGKGTKPLQNKNGKNGQEGGDFSQEQEPMFYILPSPKLPEKVTE